MKCIDCKYFMEIMNSNNMELTYCWLAGIEVSNVTDCNQYVKQV